MASITGSKLSFYGNGHGSGNVNIDLTADGSGPQPQPHLGKTNIEVFTSAPGTVASGYQASAFIPGAALVDNNTVSNVGQPNATEQLLTGSFKVIDQTGNESIQIVGSEGGGDRMTVVGSAGDTITGSTIAGTQQLIDASGKDHLTKAGPETIYGGAGPTTVQAGDGDLIFGSSGDMLVIGGSHDTIIGGSGAISIKGGTGDSVTAGSGGITTLHGGQQNGVANGQGQNGIADNQGDGTSSVMGFDSHPEAIQSATSANPDAMVGSSVSDSGGTTMNFHDGSSMHMAGVADLSKLNFLK
ncbi:MAG TPA: hypothetical protein VFX06_03670 [Stellaceae bacterium]|nr:hypothetical protein [Stellaceae bacterium]